MIAQVPDQQKKAGPLKQPIPPALKSRRCWRMTRSNAAGAGVVVGRPGSICHWLIQGLLKLLKILHLVQLQDNQQHGKALFENF